MAEEPKKRRVHWLVQVWVFFHLFAIISWTLPQPPSYLARAAAANPGDIGAPSESAQRPQEGAMRKLKDAPNYLLLYNQEYVKASPVRYYLFWTGFWQYWNMFSPNPANVDTWLDAVVTYQDGTEMVFKYPRMHDLSLTERYFKERFRKFVENTHGDMYSYKWPAIAQSIAYQSYKGDGNMPVKVVLRRHFKVIAPLKGFDPPKDYVEPGYNTYPFFAYMVDTAKIEKEVHG